MKKYWILLVIGIITLGFAACGGDDDDEGGGASGSDVEAGVITDTDGNKLYITSADWMRFDYDSNWQLTGWGDDDYFYFDVSYNPLYMEGHYLEGGSTEATTIFSNFSINSDGYITKMSYSDNFSSSDESSSQTGTFSLTYNSSGQLTKMVTSGSYKETYEGESYSGSGTSTVTFTWSNGILTSWTSSYSGSGYTETETATFDYGSYEYTNSTKQYTNSTAEWNWGDYCAFPWLGYIGVGPTYLPVSATYTWVEEEDGETYSDTYTEKYSYGFNDNGTVKWENWAGDMVYYTYSDGSSSTTAGVRAATTAESKTSVKTRTRGGMNILRRASLRHKARAAAVK